MAYQYDAMGNIIGEYESEEERLAREAREKAEREAAQQQVEKREIITRADGTQTVKTTQEVAAPIAPPAAPGAAPVSASVDPNEVFKRMLQVESGGQQFNRQGGILTSPKGAQGIAQIMPETARNPGFGVAPATPEEIATPEGNRAFGERYYQGLLKYFNGDVAKATAAYNGGAGRVERNVQANQGQMNVAQLPRETQNYLTQVLGKVANAVIPSAQAGTLTEEQRRGAPTSPTAAPTAPTALPQAAPTQAAPTQAAPTQAAPAPGIGLKPTTFGVPPTATSAPAIQSTPYIDQYQNIQNDVNELFKFRSTIPEGMDWMRKRTDDRIVELSRQEQEKEKAQQRLDDLLARQQAGDPRAGKEMARELAKDDGSWLKFLFLGFVSPELAGQELVKLGFGMSQYKKAIDANGNAVGEIQYRQDGKALKGVNLDGTPMSKRQLLEYSEDKTTKDVGVAGQTRIRDEKGNEWTSVPTKQGMRFYNNAGQRGVPVGRTVVITAGSDVELQSQLRRRQLEDKLRYAPLEKVATIIAEDEAISGPLDPGIKQNIMDRARGTGQAATQAFGGQTPAPATAPSVPAAPTTAPAAAPTTAPAAAPTTAPAAAPTTAPGEVSAVPAPAGQYPGPRKRESELRGKEREGVIKSNQEYSDTLAKDRSSSNEQLATIERIQSAIKDNPEFWGIVSGSPAWNAFKNAQSDEKKQTALGTLYTQFKIPEAKRDAFDRVANDYRNLQLKTITSSGLTATQLNTEKESERVVKTIGDLGDRPGAAAAALEFYKARIEYNNVKARAWVEARKKGVDRLEFENDFDETTGKQIFLDANERMKQISPDAFKGKPAGTPATPSAPTTSPVRKKADEILGIK